MSDFLTIQPIEVRAPLTGITPYDDQPFIRRLIDIDPAPYYDRLVASDLKLDPFRRQNKLSYPVLFPPDPALCSCGCGTTLTGKQTRWTSKTCNLHVDRIYDIIAGNISRRRQLIFMIYGYACTDCGIVQNYNIDLHIDHVIPVHLGGGLCWLSNLRPLCVPCHKEKTRKELHN